MTSIKLIPILNLNRPLEDVTGRDQQTARKRVAATIQSPFVNYPKPAIAPSSPAAVQPSVRSHQDLGASSSRAAGLGAGAAVGAGTVAAAAAAAGATSGSSAAPAVGQGRKKTSWRPVIGPWRTRSSQSTSEGSEFPVAAGSTAPYQTTSEITPTGNEPDSALGSSPNNGMMIRSCYASA
jgi:hypothetical protein